MPQQPNKWTVMIYMAGDNDLSNRCVDDLREINRMTKENGVEVVVQVDRSGEDDTRIYRFPQPKQSVDEELKFEEVPEINTGSKCSLSKFINYCLERHRAKRYMLILWGHARGMDSFSPSVTSQKVFERRVRVPAASRREGGRRRGGDGETKKPFYIICPDKSAGHAITNFELREILRETSERIGGKIDVFGMDACLMSMAEMCYELRESVQYAVGSETLVPGTSWPYHTILRHLADRPKMSTVELCNIIVEAFIKYYAPYDAQDVQLSVLDLERSDTLAGATRALARLLEPHMKRAGRRTPEDAAVVNAVIKSHWEAQSYDEDQYVDLFDFCDLLRENCGGAEWGEKIRAAASDVMLALDPRSYAAAVRAELTPRTGGFITASDWHGEDLDRSYGLSIYFPWDEVAEDRYKHLDFARPEHADWLPFIKSYVDATTRETRNTNENRAAADSFESGYIE